MKKIIKLTESDLSRIVKRVIKEEDEMENTGMSITLDDVFKGVRNALHDLGMYDDASMGEKAMDLAREIMGRMMEDIDYISENYEQELYDIIGDEEEEY